MIPCIDRIIEIAETAACQSGRLVSSEFGRAGSRNIRQKGRGDYVTDLDHASEKLIVDMIRQAFPDHQIEAEESGRETNEASFRWIIDPLDGTANFIQGIPFYSVSIGVMFEGSLITGVIFDPERNEMFKAVRGRGAWLNDKKISVSDKKSIESTVLASGFPFRIVEELDLYLSSFRAFFLKAAAIRRMGSAALDLAYTACGRLDGYWEMRLNPWDVAAGAVLIREAGGMITDFDGGDDFLESGNVVASNGGIHGEMIAVTRSIFKS